MLSMSLSPVQQQVLTLLASGSTISAAAAESGIHRNTVANWRRSSEIFRDTLASMQYEQTMHWRDQIEAIAGAALAALQALIADPTTPASVRLRAVLAVLNKITALPPTPPSEQNLPGKSTSPHNPAQGCTDAKLAELLGLTLVDEEDEVSADAEDLPELELTPYQEMLRDCTVPPVYGRIRVPGEPTRSPAPPPDPLLPG
jgi:transposase-like protein